MDRIDLRFISPLVRFALTEPPIRPVKKTESKQEKQTINHIEGENDMTAFYYGFAEPMNTRIKIEGDRVKCNYHKITGITFNGYPMLNIQDLILENCSFECCNTVRFLDCKLINCHFHDIATVYATRTIIDGCDFEKVECDNNSALSLEESEVSFCNFKDVALTNGAYLANGDGDVWIESCSFENIATDQEDGELFFCEKTVGKIFKKTVQFRIVDTASCRGLDQVKCTNKTPEHPTGELWIQAMKRGINIEKAMEIARDGVCCDESRWDAHTLGLVIGDMIVKIPVYNCLTRAGLRTVGDLVRLDFEQILKIKNLGKTVITEVVSLLHALGIEGSAWDYLT